MKKRKLIRLLSTVMCLILLFSTVASLSASAAVTVVSVDPVFEEIFTASETVNMTYRGTTYPCVGIQSTQYFNLSNGSSTNIFVSLWNGKKTNVSPTARYAGTYHILGGYTGCIFSQNKVTIRAWAKISDTNSIDLFGTYEPAQSLYDTNYVYTLENRFYTTYPVRVFGTADITTNLTGVAYKDTAIYTTSDSSYYSYY